MFFKCFTKSIDKKINFVFCSKFKKIKFIFVTSIKNHLQWSKFNKNFEKAVKQQNNEIQNANSDVIDSPEANLNDNELKTEKENQETEGINGGNFLFKK